MSEISKEKSIIEILQKMVRENAPEEEIVNSLLSLGVSEEQAKRLLLIAQADTFTLLQSELDKIVKKQVDEKQKELEDKSQKFIDKTLAEKRKELDIELEKKSLKYNAELSKNQSDFQKNVGESIAKLAKLNEDAYLTAQENKKMIDSVQKDLTETKLKGIKVRKSVARNSLMVFGILCFISAIASIAYNLFVQTNIDFITAAAVFGFIGAIIIYLSTSI
jgi:hypothetical protein